MTNDVSTPPEPTPDAPPAGTDGSETAPATSDAAAEIPEEEEDLEVDDDDDYGPPFVAKTFGGAFVWARGDGFVTTVLRVREGKSVPVATANRRDMHLMLTGGRAILEVDNGTDVDRVELLPASPVLVDAHNAYRLIAMTEVELFTVFSTG